MRSTTIHAAPTKSTTPITSAASTNPRGTATTARNGPTGAGCTRWYVPATTTLRPVAGSSRRSYSPDGSSHVSAAHTAAPASSRMTGCGSFICRTLCVQESAADAEGRDVFREQRLLRTLVRPFVLRQLRLVGRGELRASGDGYLILREHRGEDRIGIRRVPREVTVENRQRVAEVGGHHVRDREALAEIVVGRMRGEGGLQDRDDRFRLLIAHPRVGEHRVDRERPLVAADRQLPDAGCIAILAGRGIARAEQQRGREELAARPRRDRELRRRLIELPLRVEIEPFEEGRRLLVAGRKGIERRRPVL